MTEDALDQLAQLEKQSLLPEWEEVVAGRLSADEAASRCRARGVDEATIERARELFQPVTDEEILAVLIWKGLV